MKYILQAVAKVNTFIGSQIMHWLTFVLVLILTFEVTSRYIFNAPTMWANQLSIMLLGAIVAMGWGWVHERREHVRVDIFYMNYSPWTKALVDVIGFILLFFPLFAALVFESWRNMVSSWQQHEVMTETYWFPPVGPSRTIIFIGLLLLLLQGIAGFICDMQVLIRRNPDVRHKS